MPCSLPCEVTGINLGVGDFIDMICFLENFTPCFVGDARSTYNENSKLQIISMDIKI